MPEPEPATLFGDRRPGGITTIRQALDDGVPYAIVVEREVVAIDVDLTGDDAAAATERPLAWCRAHADHIPVVLRSSPSGRRHVWVRLRSATLRTKLTALAVELGLDVRSGRGGRIRPPGTPSHKTGHWPVLLSHDTWEQALAALDPQNRTKDRALGRTYRPAWKRPPAQTARTTQIAAPAEVPGSTSGRVLVATLPAQWRRMIETGEHNYRHADGRLDASCACAAVSLAIYRLAPGSRDAAVEALLRSPLTRTVQ